MPRCGAWEALLLKEKRPEQKTQPKSRACDPVISGLKAGWSPGRWVSTSRASRADLTGLERLRAVCKKGLGSLACQNSNHGPAVLCSAQRGSRHYPRRPAAPCQQRGTAASRPHPCAAHRPALRPSAASGRGPSQLPARAVRPGRQLAFPAQAAASGPGPAAGPGLAECQGHHPRHRDQPERTGCQRFHRPG